MRTTLDIDTDVLIAVKEKARKEKRSAGRVISNIVRNSLNGTSTASGPDFILKSGIPVLASRGEVITYEHVQRLLDEEDY